MIRITGKRIAALALAPALGMLSAAAPPAMGASAPGASASSSEYRAANYRGSRLLGMDVENARGDEVGEVEDIVVDMGTGEARYVILSYGGVLGIGDRLYAVPLGVLSPSGREGDRLVVSLTETELRRQPAFVPDQWPAFDDAAYWDGVERRGEAASTARARAFRHGMRLSDLIDRDVQNRRGEELGEVEDAVIDLAHQRVHFLVVEADELRSATGPGVLAGERLVPLPLQTFYPPAAANGDDDALVLRVSESRLQALPGFDDDAWPDFNDRSFLSRLDAQSNELFDRDAVAQGR